MDMTYLRRAWRVFRWEGESNEGCGTSTYANRVKCGVVEWVKRNTLKCFGHVERMRSGEFVKVYESESEA